MQCHQQFFTHTVTIQLQPCIEPLNIFHKKMCLPVIGFFCWHMRYNWSHIQSNLSPSKKFKLSDMLMKKYVSEFPKMAAVGEKDQSLRGKMNHLLT